MKASENFELDEVDLKYIGQEQSESLKYVVGKRSSPLQRAICRTNAF